jgi:hypothetical protein
MWRDIGLSSEVSEVIKSISENDQYNPKNAGWGVGYKNCFIK